MMIFERFCETASVAPTEAEAATSPLCDVMQNAVTEIRLKETPCLRHSPGTTRPAPGTPTTGAAAASRPSFRATQEAAPAIP